LFFEVWTGLVIASKVKQEKCEVDLRLLLLVYFDGRKCSLDGIKARLSSFCEFWNDLVKCKERGF
jgi:hypothetical protein